MESKYREALDAYNSYGSKKAAAEMLGLHRSTYRNRLQRAIELSQEEGKPAPAGDDRPDIGPLPDGELSYEELKAYRAKVFDRKVARVKAEKWRPIKFKNLDPVCITTFGDPHVDDDGCNWPQLARDTETVIKTPGMFGGSIGDQINNWIGRLAIKYADQSSTESQAWRLSEGWIRELANPGKLIFLVRGNHDLWSGNGDPLDWIMRGVLAADAEWQAQLEFRWPGVEPVRMWAAHDFPGHSQYNALHAMTKKHLWHGAQADIYLAGHRHHWAISEEEDEAGNLVWKARARGYKFIDEYADRLGHSSQQHGASISFVVQPRKSGPERIRAIPCVQEAAEYLTFCRQRAK